MEDLKGCMVIGLGFSGKYVADGAEEAMVVEPVGPFERCKLGGFNGSPLSAPMDHLGLVNAIGRLRQRMVIAVVVDTLDLLLDLVIAPGTR